jgi:SAM-dependent methyltransferase
MRIVYKLAKHYFKLATKKQIVEWEKIYGEFDKTDYEDYKMENLPNESSVYHGEIIKWARDIFPPPKRVLLAGENKSTAKYIQEKIQVQKVYTAGLADADFKWDFEEDPPQMGQFDLIISQAILEHLINPYKHMQDLDRLLLSGGYLIVHTAIPGFWYHRFPIDAFRFFPDWFEEMAKKLKLSITRKRIKRTQIFYMYKKIN